MSVALTSTINLLFGSKVLDRNTGIILNDEMDDFSIPGVPNAFGLSPSVYNYIGKYLCFVFCFFKSLVVVSSESRFHFVANSKNQFQANARYLPLCLRLLNAIPNSRWLLVDLEVLKLSRRRLL